MKSPILNRRRASSVTLARTIPIFGAPSQTSTSTAHNSHDLYRYIKNDEHSNSRFVSCFWLYSQFMCSVLIDLFHLLLPSKFIYRSSFDISFVEFKTKMSRCRIIMYTFWVFQLLRNVQMVQTACLKCCIVTTYRGYTAFVHPRI